MGDLLYGLAWIVWGAVCGSAGAYLLGPALYRRRLRRELERLTPTDPTPIDHDALRSWLERMMP